jgi:hypothetical protein
MPAERREPGDQRPRVSPAFPPAREVLHVQQAPDPQDDRTGDHEPEDFRSRPEQQESRLPAAMMASCFFAMEPIIDRALSTRGRRV